MLYTHPRPDNDEYGSTDAAWASCFVNTDDPEEAATRARELLGKVGWDTEELEDSQVVTREQYLNNPDSLARFDQALIDGIVITLNTWNVGAADG